MIYFYFLGVIYKQPFSISRKLSYGLSIISYTPEFEKGHLYMALPSVQDIYRYLFVYIADAEKNEIDDCYKDKTILYDYYDLKRPPLSWINYC